MNILNEGYVTAPNRPLQDVPLGFLMCLQPPAAAFSPCSVFRTPCSARVPFVHLKSVPVFRCNGTWVEHQRNTSHRVLPSLAVGQPAGTPSGQF